MMLKNKHYCLIARIVRMKNLLFIILFIQVQLNSTSFADSSSHIIGHPLTKASCEATVCNHMELTETDQAKYEMIITESKDQYFWTSRESKLLYRSKSGAFIFFINQDGSGYIKATIINGQCQYLEHIGIGLQTITYWGTCEGL